VKNFTIIDIKTLLIYEQFLPLCRLLASEKLIGKIVFIYFEINILS